MTIYKAFRNFYIFLISLAVALGAIGGGFLAYELCYPDSGDAAYVLSKYGSTGNEVRTLQQKLKDLGFYNGSVDGIFGSQTQSAVRSFSAQRRHYGGRNRRPHNAALFGSGYGCK